MSDLAIPGLDAMPAPLGKLLPTECWNGRVSFEIDLIREVGRPDAVPELALRYDGETDGVFGFGWSLSSPSIRRGTGRRLPRYRDEGPDADRYTTSADGELVAQLASTAAGWAPVREVREGYEVSRFRPRVESRFARLERWRELSSGIIHWRETSRDDVTRIFGRSADCRIADPADATRISEWLLEEERDSRGNVLRWSYQAEDLAGLDDAMRQAEQLRAPGPGPARHPKRLYWANRTPGRSGDELFELVFDYGEHDPATPSTAADGPWQVRPDLRSRYRTGFEVRTRRLCRRVLLFSHLPELATPDAAGLGATGLGAAAPGTLLRSYELRYSSDAARSLLTEVAYTGWRSSGETGRQDALPRLRLGYTQPTGPGPVRELRDERGAPLLAAAGASWFDLDADGLPGLLSRDYGGTLRYRRNLGDGRLTDARPLASRPAVTDARATATQLAKPFGDARTAVLDSRHGPGFQDRSSDGDWHGWAAFAAVASSVGAGARSVDLTGDGMADVLAADNGSLRWHPAAGRHGWAWVESAPATLAAQAVDDRSGTVLLADMTGDGLTDLVQVRPGSVRYWPNLGYGRFGAPVELAGAPALAGPDRFGPERVRLADVDGTGPADLIYLADDGVICYPNRSGNSFGNGYRLGQLPACRTGDTVDTLDLLGTGGDCLVWTPDPRTVAAVPRFVELGPGPRPYLLDDIDDGSGMRTRIGYTSSTEVMLADAAAGHRWRSALPFPVPLVAEIRQRDEITGAVVVTAMSYRHGSYDDVERELAGFGYVEQRRTEILPAARPDAADWQPPALQVSRWYHTGISDGGIPRIDELTAEFYQGDPGRPARPGVRIDPGPAASSGGLPSRELLRALAGRLAREERYGLDGDPASVCPRSTTDYGYLVRPLQPAGEDDAPPAVAAFEQHVVQRSYERIPDDPRAEQHLALRIDAAGNVGRQLTLRHPRRHAEIADQGRASAVLTETDFLNRDEPASYRLGIETERRRYEIGPLPAPSGAELWSVADIERLLADDRLADIAFEASIDPAGPPQRRPLAALRIRYWNDALVDLAPAGTAGRLALPATQLAQALTAGLVRQVYGDSAASALSEAGYLFEDGSWWAPGPTQSYTAAFALPATQRRPSGGTGWIGYDPYQLLAVRLTDEVGNTEHGIPDYWSLSLGQLRDANGVVESVTFDGLGLPLSIAVGEPTTSPEQEVERDLLAWQREGLPRRVTRRGRPGPDAADADISIDVAVFDGAGNVVEGFAGAEPDPVSGQLRWASTGRQLFTVAGAPARSYAPYFADDPVLRPEAAVPTPATRYRSDELGRIVAVLGADGTVQRTVYEPWRQLNRDAVDCLRGSPWQARRQAPEASPDDRAALAASLPAADTPMVELLDASGESVRSSTDLGAGVVAAVDQQRDVDGRVVAVIDPRRVAAETTVHDMLGQPIAVRSSASGTTRALYHVEGYPVLAWNGLGQQQRLTYDQAGRLRERGYRTDTDGWRVVEHLVYGDRLADPPPFSRGRIVQHFDGAGRLVLDYDRRGNVTTYRRTLRADLSAGPVDWSVLADAADEPGEPGAAGAADELGTVDEAELAARAAPLLGEELTTTVRYDELSRPIARNHPDGSGVEVGYGRRELPTELTARTAEGDWQPVARLDYDAAGRRIAVRLGNGVVETFGYDAASSWLQELTTRTASGVALRAQRFTTDPVGNVVVLRDSAQQPQFYGNAVISADRVFGYDAAYRLVSATGREAVPATLGPLWQRTAAAASYPDLRDRSAVQQYTESYEYDLAGNLTAIRHAAATQGWTARFDIAATGDRVVGLRDADGALLPGSFEYDAAGNALALGGLTGLHWDDESRLTRVELGGGGTAYHAYDAEGRRVHSVVVRQGSLVDGCVRLDGWRRARRQTTDGALVAELTSLVVSAGGELLAVLDRRITRDAAAPLLVRRYQHADAVGSVVLETGPDGQPISYEEYRPYGGTAYRVVTPELPPTPYRFGGAERDDDTGLDLHGVRCYAPWLARWISPDPAGLVDGPNRYWYGRDNPIRNTDPDGRQSVPRTPPPPPSPAIVSWNGQWGAEDPNAAVSVSIPAPQRPPGRLLDYERSLLPSAPPPAPPPPAGEPRPPGATPRPPAHHPQPPHQQPHHSQPQHSHHATHHRVIQLPAMDIVGHPPSAETGAVAHQLTDAEVDRIINDAFYGPPPDTGVRQSAPVVPWRLPTDQVLRLTGAAALAGVTIGAAPAIVGVISAVPYLPTLLRIGTAFMTGYRYASNRQTATATRGPGARAELAAVGGTALDMLALRPAVEVGTGSDVVSGRTFTPAQRFDRLVDAVGESVPQVVLHAGAAGAGRGSAGSNVVDDIRAQNRVRDELRALREAETDAAATTAPRTGPTPTEPSTTAESSDGSSPSGSTVESSAVDPVPRSVPPYGNPPAVGPVSTTAGQQLWPYTPMPRAPRYTRNIARLPARLRREAVQLMAAVNQTRAALVAAGVGHHRLLVGGAVNEIRPGVVGRIITVTDPRAWQAISQGRVALPQGWLLNDRPPRLRWYNGTLRIPLQHHVERTAAGMLNQLGAPSHLWGLVYTNRPTCAACSFLWRNGVLFRNYTHLNWARYVR